MSLTIITTYNGTLSLAASDNPVSLTSTGAVVATASGADAIDGGSGVNWQITNDGAVSSTFGYGINLAGPGAITDSGSISGTGGVLLSDDGSVTIAAQGTVTATGLMPSPLATISAIYVTGPSGGGAISVNNAGVLNAADGYGIGLGASGSVINSGQVTGGEDGVVVLAGSGDIQNTGSIVATLDDGVGLFAGGTVTNAAGASISGIVGANAAGIFITGGLGTITNSGGIAGFDYGVLVAADGTVTNNSTGTITGQNVGVAMSHGGTLSNSGTVSATATGAAGADFELGGNINNYLGGSISGAWYGAFITGALGAVVNAGAISGNVYYGVSLNDGGSVENDATGSIVGQTAGVNLSNQSATVVNTGSISALGSGSAAVTVNAGGEVINNSGGTLSAVAYGMFASGLSATFSNAGLVTGRDAVGLEAGGAVTNLAGGTLSGQNAGVYVAGGSGAVNNSGSIAASASGGAAIDLEASGSVTNNAGGTVTGSAYGIFSAGGLGVVSNAAGASISGGSASIFMTGGAGTLTNSGAITSTGSVGVDAEGAGNVITNESVGTISGGSYGVFVGGPGTVTNLGSISGGAYAVDFTANSNANLLQAGAGATFNGSVNGDGGILELLSGAGSIGGVSGAGQFYGFQSLLVDSGASWSLSGTGNSIANLTDNGALSIEGSLDVTQAVNPGSVGVFDLNTGGVLELAAATGSQTAVNFQGASQLVIDNAALFGTGIGGTSYQGSLLENFGAGDSCDILNFSAQNASCAYDPTSGLLQVSNGSQQATLDFQQSTLGGGSFQIGADVSGNGVLITFQPAIFTVVSVATFEANQTQLDALVGGFSISDTAANVSAALDQLNSDSHVTSIALTDPPTPGLTLSVAQALGDTTALNKITTSYTILISDTAANVAANLGALNDDTQVTSIALADPGTQTFTLTLAQALNDSRALSEITTPHMLALADTAANIASILPTQASTLKAAGYTSVTSTTGAVTMTVAEAQLLSDDGIAVIGGPLSATGTAATMLALTTAQASSLSGAGYTLVVLDTAADIQSLTATQIAGLGSLHVTQIAASDTNVALKVAQAAALETAGIRVAAPAGSTVTVTDTSPNLGAMAAGVIAGLPALGVSDIVRTSGSVSIAVAQAIALENALLRINGPGGAAATVTMSDTGANIASVTAGQMGLLAATGVSRITSTSGGVTLTVAQALALESLAIKITVPTGSVVAVSDTALDIQALGTTQIAGLKAVGVTILSASDANVSLTVAQAAALETAGVSLSPPSGGSDSILDTAANIQKVTAKQIAGLGTLHVTQIAAGDASVALTVAQAAALETGGIPVAAPGGSRVTVSDTAQHLQALTVAQINALSGIGVSGLVSTNANVSYSVAQTSAILTDGLTVAAAGTHTITENFGNGYSVFESGALITQKSVNADGSYDIAHFNTGLGYSSYEDIFNSAGTKLLESRDMNDGSGALLLYANGLITNSGSGALSATTGADTFAFNPHSLEAITASGHTGESFEFDGQFGQSAITGFAATGSSHDLVQLDIASFSYLNASMTQAQDAATLLTHSVQSGANVVITDTLGSSTHDTLTLNNVTKTTLTANLSDFRFV